MSTMIPRIQKTTPDTVFHRLWQDSFTTTATLDNIVPLGGGSISNVFRAETSEGYFVMKVNSSERFPGLFRSEQQGLELLRQAGGPPVPEVIACRNIDGRQVLLMEYVPTATARWDFFRNFGESLAALHRTCTEYYGLDHDNWMGALRQYNHPVQTLEDFFIRQRLVPQVAMAQAAGRLCPADLHRFERLYAKLPALLPDEPAVLIHGDLWNGNFLEGADGRAWLIDPAVSFACREMDIAMTRLFGGFDQTFYAAYQHAHPMLPGWQERTSLWNLYPLLVHVNIFGGGYAGEVRSVLKRFVG